jgi:gamma-glutamylcyclotransferase (GGCT)/AIG2-like uncharacterized protein YtfP
MAIYAAYGSNLDPKRMLELAPHSPAIGPGWLPGWRLTFGGADLGWECALPTIVEDPGHQVFVMLYALTEADEKNLNSAEGFDLGFYTKIRVRVSTLEKDETAWIYVVQGYEDGLPLRKYVDDIIKAATIAGAPADYIEYLQSRVVLDSDDDL